MTILSLAIVGSHGTNGVSLVHSNLLRTTTVKDLAERATGGVYLAGGVVVHALDALYRPAFMGRFKRKERFTELMARIPIQKLLTRSGIRVPDQTISRCIPYK
jgi:glucokinase